MRFACQSCGKAYNLPEERIADKSNVKLKCRVCGAIVEVKKQGELVAQVLNEGDTAMHAARVSEAPAPLMSIGPEDDDDPDGATVSISEASLNDSGPLEFGFLGMPPTPALAPSSLPPPPVNRAEAGPPQLEGAGVAPSSPPLPLSPPVAPAPLVSAPLGAGLSGPPPLRLDGAAGPATNGSNGAGHYSLNEGPSARERGEGPLLAPIAPSPARGAPVSSAALSPAAVSSAAASLSAAALASPALSAAPGDVGVTLGSATEREGDATASNDLYKMMFAAFVTGVVVDRIFAGLFF
ncbi:MAG TPA: zinc-ribbon domain-containing protein [Polyangiaceae bacterium]|nr:zinc-ribbon domain-containing protein [Polyangiaceae bacterium]